MGSVSIGPFAFDGPRLAVIVGVVIFLTVGSLLSRHRPRLSSCTTGTVVTGLVGARAGHVAYHFASFAEEPWRIFAVWQGGFSFAGAAIGVAIGIAWLAARSLRDVPWAGGAVAAGFFAWFVVNTLTSSGVAPMAPTQPFQTVQDEKTAVLAERHGRPAVINLWATWCPPCRREMPMLAEMARENPDVDFIFANQGENREAIQSYLQSAGIKLNFILLDPFLALSRHYGAQGLPATLLVRADGTLATSHLGEISKESLLEAISVLQE